MSECASCGLPILDRYVFNVLGKSWHQSCLRCSDCLCNMSDTCFSRDGLILCKEDFSRRFSQRCAGCDGALEKEDLVRRAKEKVFHVHCFQCSVCQRRLDTGEHLYILDGNKFVCQTDFQMATKSSTPSSTSNRPASNAPSECNSDADEENIDASEEVAAEGEEGDKGDDSAAAKRRGPRTTIKAKQLETLKSAFNSTPKPTRHIREQLAQETGLNMRVIQVWFQNRRSKERRMKQMRFGGAYRTTRRSRGGRDDVMCQDMFGPDGGPPPFFGQPPMGFFCDPYGPDGNGLPPPPGAPLPPPFMQPPDAPMQISHDGFERTSPMDGGLPQGMMSPDFDPEMGGGGYLPLPSMYPTELKPMTGW